MTSLLVLDKNDRFASSLHVFEIAFIWGPDKNIWLAWFATTDLCKIPGDTNLKIFRVKTISFVSIFLILVKSSRAQNKAVIGFIMWVNALGEKWN